MGRENNYEGGIKNNGEGINNNKEGKEEERRIGRRNKEL
jgi:hypothetical protein